MAEESKRRKAEEMEDRISNLPDGVLNHILSFLPTKSAVATGRLSRRWRHLWQHLSVLNFIDDSHYEHDESRRSRRFRNFSVLVNSVLVFLRSPRGIRKMTLQCDHSPYDDEFRRHSIDTWVRASIGPHLEELNLNLFYDYDYYGPGFKLPQSLFTSTNLVSLSLNGEAIHVHIQSSTAVTLPSLKVLLINISNVKVSSMNALFRGCPVVETLDLCFSVDHLDTVCIPTSLKWLKIFIMNNVGAYLEINAPNLEYLNISEITLSHVTAVTLPSLKVLLINISNVEVSFVNALFRGCPVVETLDLCFSADHLDTVCIPTSLKWLKIIIQNDVGAYLEINAPDLEYLDITGITFGHVFSMYNLHNVVEAYLDVFPQSFSSVIPSHNLLDALSRTTELVLSLSTTKWLLGEPHDLRFQEFRYLLCLEIFFPWFNPNYLLSLLKKCPMLRNLTIQDSEEQSLILSWALPPSAPNCLVSHLTFIEFKGFRGFPDQVSFVEYLLQKGPVLKTMIIDVLFMELEKKYSIVKMLCNLPRASATCQLTID